MKTNLKKLIIAAATIVVISIIVVLASTGDGASTTTNSLSKIYSQANIKDKGDHYLIDSKEVYSRTIGSGNNQLLIVVEKTQYGGVYRFYIDENNPKLIKEAEVFGPLNDNEDAFSRNFFEKDITGDGAPELFIKAQVTGGNLASYEILQWKNGGLANLKLSGERNPLVDFDEISYENNYVAMTWHAVDANGKTWYKISDTEFVPMGNVGFFQVPGNPDVCEVRVNKVYDEFTVVDTKSCSALGKDFGPYFTN